jgi:hypothetical protein
MRRAANPAITAQMYRHFATMTVAVTALIAFFANGEKQTAVAAQPVATQPAAAKKATPPPTDASDNAGSWGSDDGGDFGQPTSPTYSSAGSWFSNPFGANGGDRAVAEAPAMPGLDNDPDDPNASPGAPAPPSAADIAAATAASKMRSGAPSID